MFGSVYNDHFMIHERHYSGEERKDAWPNVKWYFCRHSFYSQAFNPLLRVFLRKRTFQEASICTLQPSACNKISRGRAKYAWIRVKNKPSFAHYAF